MSQEKSKEFTITRVINAPRDLVFKTFTEAEHLAHWWGPAGCALKVIELNVKAGGKFHYSMVLPNGFEMFGIFNYQEVNAPEKIIFTNAFSDAEGNITRAPFSPIWPLEVLNIWALEETNGKTTLTLKGHPINASEEERTTFEENFEGMQQGFSATFDQLDTYLTKITS